MEIVVINYYYTIVVLYIRYSWNMTVVGDM